MHSSGSNRLKSAHFAAVEDRGAVAEFAVRITPNAFRARVAMERTRSDYLICGLQFAARSAYNDSTHGDRNMATLTIRKLDPAIKERLRIQAAEHGHSMEAEARRILQDAFKSQVRAPERNLYERIRARFEPLGGVELQLPLREQAREPPRFD